MRFVGIDVIAERHVVAVVDEADRVLLKATPFTEDAEGYAKLFGVLGEPPDALVAMEATGHYWKNLAALVAAGFAVALLNPVLRQKLVRLGSAPSGIRGRRPRAGPETGGRHPHAADPCTDAPDSRWIEGERAGEAGRVTHVQRDRGTEDRFL